MKKSNDYKQWLIDLKNRIRQSQIKAAVKVNSCLIHLYWDMGQDIVNREMESAWGSGFFEQLSKDLRSEFPRMQGFSSTNLKYIKRFYLFYAQEGIIRQQLVNELPIKTGKLKQVNKNIPNRQQLADDLNEHPIFQIPWFHHVQIFTKSKSLSEALFYVQKKTIENGWSRSVLMNFMETDLFSAQGKALTNFSRLLPQPQSDLANQILKDPYNLDFITLTEDYMEREMEDALTENITKFLLELGQGFAYVGRQIPIKTGENERFIDMLFYHLELRCFVVVELKTGKFEPEYVGKVGLYISAINHQMKKETDNPTIGIIICKVKDHIEVQYALEITNQPIGVLEYHLSKILPKNYKSSLPSIKEIEKELKKIDEKKANQL
jgi:predicted nuclease of restriction endonuclease-like (RecB) superfamily